MHFPNVNITVEALFLLYSQEKCGAFFSYNLHKKIRVPHLWRKITWSIWDPSVFKMAAKSDFSQNHKKIRFVDIAEISPERYITGHKETTESLKNRVNFPESCPLINLPELWKFSKTTWYLFMRQNTRELCNRSVSDKRVKTEGWKFLKNPFFQLGFSRRF